ncbi:MAG: multidrug efflux RND transporter permease subunit [Planctomycetota bacterium]|nr:multidrug efflux RND transporter permease subunit [Planctomycetota bacterium]
MSTFFIKRPVFACVISIIILLLGAVSYFRLPVEQYPDLAPPVVRVEALYPGADARTIADTVAAPIEQQVNGVDNMIYMSSTSSDGRYSLDVSFRPGVDVDLMAVLVQNRVNIASATLPEEVRRLGVTTRKQSTSLAGVISLSSPGGSISDLDLSNFLSTYWRDEFSRVPGVGAISIMPAKDYSMRIWLSPDKLKARGMTVIDVQNAIRAQNLQVPAGAIGRQPAPAGTDLELIVTTRGRLLRPDEFADIIVRSGAGGDAVRIKDIARVELGSRDYSTVSTFNGKPNAIAAIYQLPGANLVEVADSLRAKLEDLNRSDSPLRASTLLGPDVSAKFFYDSSMFINASLKEVIKTLVEAFILVFVVVLIFLQSLRTTLIPALTIPVSLIGTFLLLLLFGFSINMLSMFGLVLAIGIVVDDAIVVVENVERNMTQFGLGAREATIRAMGEITGPVIAITLVLMSVFLPSAALPGITGEMYRQFALTIAASTALSAVCALTLAPALCALLLKAHGTGHAGAGDSSAAAKRQGGGGFVLLRPFRWAGRAFNTAFDRVTTAYAWLIRQTLRFALLSALLFAGVIFLTLRSLQSVPTGFVPEEDLGFVVVGAQLPDGASLERTNAVIERVSEKIQDIDGVEDVVALSGFSVIQGQGSTYGNCWVVLKPWDERYTKQPYRSIQAIIADINQQIAPIQEAQFIVFSLPAISGVGNASGFDLRVQDRANQGRDALQQVVDETIATTFQQPGIAYAFTGYRSGVPQLFVDIDREKALAMGVPLESIYATLSASLGSAYVNDFNRTGRTYQVTLQADAAFRLKPSDILKFEVRNRNGDMLPLGTLATVRDTIGPDRIERYNLYQTATINGIPARGTSSGDALGIMERLAQDTIVGAGMGYEWTGMSYQEKISTGGLLVFALGILLVYLILAAQYESWSTPLAVVFSVPLVVIGAMVALLYRGLDNNVFTQIGLVLLIGLGAKNAILIVEFARENRAAGKSIRDSAIEAARTRFRPILMTSFAFILGVVPLLSATGAGASSRRALGTAVFGGMVGATILGLFFIPVLYFLVQRASELISPPKKTAKGDHPAEHDSRPPAEPARAEPVLTEHRPATA